MILQGIGVLDVVVLQRGEAVVVFNTVMDQHMALQRDRYAHTPLEPLLQPHLVRLGVACADVALSVDGPLWRVWRWCRQNMGRRYIEVFHAKRSDYYNAISQTWGSGDNQGQGGGQGQGERGGAGPR